MLNASIRFHGTEYTSSTGYLLIQYQLRRHWMEAWSHQLKSQPKPEGVGRISFGTRLIASDSLGPVGRLGLGHV